MIPRKNTDLWNPWWLWHLYSHSGLKTTTLIFMLSHHLILSQHNIIYVLLKGKKILPSFDSFSPLKPRHVKFTFYSLSILLVINEKYEVFQLLFLSLFYFFFFPIIRTVHIHITQAKRRLPARYDFVYDWSPGSCHHASLTPYVSRSGPCWMMLWFLSGFCIWKRGEESLRVGEGIKNQDMGKKRDKEWEHGQNFQPHLEALNLS